ncbi:MAG: hypothetical protein GY771_00800 [bacterium]|nr:hypothetical protein [bacterium]
MKRLLVLTVIFATATFAVMDTHLEGKPSGSVHPNYEGTKDVLVDNLVPSASDIVSGYSMYGPNNWWLAIDWSPSGADYTWENWAFHLIPLGDHPYDLNIEVYDTDLNTTPIDSFTVPVGDITDTDTGMTAFGNRVYLCEMNIICNVNFLNGGYYWIAQTFDAIDNIFWIVWWNVIDLWIYFYDGSAWYSAPDYFGENSEGSYMIEWDYHWPVESASVGEIKVAYK